MVTGLWGAATAVAATAQNRALRQLTTANEAHNDPVLSPDGSTVAFRGPSKIGVVAAAGGGSEGTLANSATLGGDIVWAPSSAGIYYRDGLTVRFVSRSGGPSRQVASLPDAQHRLWCVDAADRTLYLTRFVATSRQYVLFTLPTSGGAISDLVSSALVIQEVGLDPSGTWIQFQELPSGPFTQREFVRVDLAGNNRVSLGKPPTAANVGPGHFVDNGTTIVFSFVSASSNGFHIGRLSVTSTTAIESLTEGSLQRNSAVVTPGGWRLDRAAGAIPKRSRTGGDAGAGRRRGSTAGRRASATVSGAAVDRSRRVARGVRLPRRQRDPDLRG